MEDVTFRERAVYIDRAGGVLIVSDLHVGRDEASGVSFPLGEREDLQERLSRLLAHFDPDVVVFAGDILHRFEHVSESSRSSFAELRALCAAANVRLELVGGNHDTVLTEVCETPVSDEYVLDAADDSFASNHVGVSTAAATDVEQITEKDSVVAAGPVARSRVEEANAAHTVVCHGHEPPTTPATRYLIGHLHPAIEIEGDRHPCYLIGEGTYDGADVVVLPAFNRLAPGVLVNRVTGADLDSPLLPDAGGLRPVVYDTAAQDTLWFPPLADFQRYL